MTHYYRGENRDDLKHVEGRGRYGDGGGRPKTGCERELAFADSIGGAIYGSAQYHMHGSDTPSPSEFLDESPKMKIYIYKTDEKPTYAVVPTSSDFTLGDITDFDLTGEVRYCDKRVPVEKVCSIDLTGRDLALLKSYIYYGLEKDYFDFDRELPERCRGKEGWAEAGCMDLFDALWSRVLAGDSDLIRKILRDEPEIIEFEHDVPYGIKHEIVQEMMGIWEGRCK